MKPSTLQAKIDYLETEGFVASARVDNIQTDDNGDVESADLHIQHARPINFIDVTVVVSKI
jgi:hypothetical protein